MGNDCFKPHFWDSWVKHQIFLDLIFLEHHATDEASSSDSEASEDSESKNIPS